MIIFQMFVIIIVTLNTQNTFLMFQMLMNVTPTHVWMVASALMESTRLHATVQQVGSETGVK